jgi:hypothetical protein
MFDVMFDSMRKASEASVRTQQDMFRQLTQQWLSSSNPTGTGAEWTRNLQKRWRDSTLEAMNRHRESVDSLYRSGIEVLEQAFQLNDATSPEDYRRLSEELWRKVFELTRTHSEAQFREAQRWAERSFRITQNGLNTNGAS